MNSHAAGFLTRKWADDIGARVTGIAFPSVRPKSGGAGKNEASIGLENVHTEEISNLEGGWTRGSQAGGRSTHAGNPQTARGFDGLDGIDSGGRRGKADWWRGESVRSGQRGSRTRFAPERAR